MDWTTQGFDNQRTGWNPGETVLTTANVGRLQTRFTLAVDGQVYAQPLYVSQLVFPDGTVHNTCFVATEGDSVYAFDTEVPGPPLWHRQLLGPGETTVPWNDVQPSIQDANIYPQIGITSTPVIDRAKGTIFVAAKTKESPNTYHYRIHALELTTGNDKPGSPVEVAGAVPGSGSGSIAGQLAFDPRRHLNRPALLLRQGLVHIAFGSHADQTPYHGWIFAYDADTLVPRGHFCTSPDQVPGQGGSLGDPGSGAAIWQSGVGLAADDGSIYFLTGNGPFNANEAGGRDYGDTLVRLAATGGALWRAAYFTPSNQGWLRDADIDFGSGSVLIIPMQPGVHPTLLVCCGKYAVVYLLREAGLQLMEAVQSGRVTRLPGGGPAQGGVWGGPAYYAGIDGTFIYYALSDDSLKAFRLASGTLRLATLPDGAYNQSTDEFPSGGATPTVSSHQAQPGTAVVWLVRRGDPLVLYAYNASDVRSPLVRLSAGSWRNPNGAPFVQPTVADGHVIVGSEDRVTVFGL